MVDTGGDWVEAEDHWTASDKAETVDTICR